MRKRVWVKMEVEGGECGRKGERLAMTCRSCHGVTAIIELHEVEAGMIRS